MIENSNTHLPHPWQDITSFSRGDKDRTPKTWTAKFGAFKITLTRHIHYSPDQWVASSPGVFHIRPMESKDLHEAASQAQGSLKAALEDALSAMDNHKNA